MTSKRNCKKASGFALPVAAAVAALFGGMGAAQAFEINTGNPDISLVWGNTVRYNIGERIHKRSDVIGNNANADEGDYSYDKGDIVTNRLDYLTEVDFNYQKKTGFRFSASAWYDEAFHDEVRTNPALAARGSYVNNQFSNYTKRYTKGLSGEILDANVFANFDLGDMPLSVRVGRQTVLWGEAVALSAHSVSYAQAPTDGYKALANPGVDAKEISLPVGQVAGTLAITPRLSVSAQYYFEWKPTRVAEGGTYLEGTDFILAGPDRFSLAPGRFLQNQGIVKAKNSGEWGINSRWQPGGWLGNDGTVGVYYREFSERSPTISLNVAGGTYRAVYPENAKLYGVSLSKIIGGLSIGSELVHRENTALTSSIANGSPEGARGDTNHFLLNAIYLGGQTDFWSFSSVLAEVAYSRWDKVTKNEPLFNTCEHRPAGDREAGTGCVTKDNWVGFFRFSPNWVAIFPGWDLAASVSYSVGLKGNGAVLGGGNYRAGSYSTGMTFTYNQRHDFTLAYNDYLATHQVNPNGTIRVSNGSQIQDRGWLVFTYKGSF